MLSQFPKLDVAGSIPVSRSRKIEAARRSFSEGGLKSIT
jgi:hypothetical protein